MSLENLQTARKNLTCRGCYTRIRLGALYRMGFGRKPHCSECWRKVMQRAGAR